MLLPAQDCTQSSSLWESSFTPLALHSTQSSVTTNVSLSLRTLQAISLPQGSHSWNSLIPFLDIHEAPPVALAIQLDFPKSPPQPRPAQLSCTPERQVRSLHRLCLWPALEAPASYLQSHTSIMSEKGTKNHPCWMTIWHSETGKTTDINEVRRAVTPGVADARQRAGGLGHYIVSWLGCWLHVCVVGKNSLSWMHAQ